MLSGIAIPGPEGFASPKFVGLTPILLAGNLKFGEFPSFSFQAFQK